MRVAGGGKRCVLEQLVHDPPPAHSSRRGPVERQCSPLCRRETSRRRVEPTRPPPYWKPVSPPLRLSDYKMDLSPCEEIADDVEVEEDDPYFQNIAEKMQIARNVVLNCEMLDNSSNSSFSEIEKIIRYTGVTEETIKMADVSLELAKTFTEWFKDQSSEENMVTFSFDRIQMLMLQLYTKSMKVASKQSITKLMDKRTKYLKFDIQRFKNYIKKQGFISKRLPGTKRSITVERTEQSLKRMEYLTKMKVYREAGRTIVYADPCFYFNNLVVSPQHGVLHKGTNYIRKNGENANMLLTKSLLISILPRNSVVVLKEDPLNEPELPTPFTSKADMISWLTNRSIPHDPTLHKADLYELIKKFKSIENSDDGITKILKCYGHDVVYLPKKLKNIDYLEVIRSEDPTLQWKIKRIKEIENMKKMGIDQWQQIEKIIISREEKMYQEDMMIEAVVDKVLTLAKYGELSDADLNECDEELQLDDYYSSIIYD